MPEERSKKSYWKETLAATTLLSAGLLVTLLNRSGPQQSNVIPTPPPVVIPQENISAAEARELRIKELETLIPRARDTVERDVYVQLYQNEHITGLRDGTLSEARANQALQKAAEEYNRLHPLEEAAEDSLKRREHVNRFLAKVESHTGANLPEINTRKSYNYWYDLNDAKERNEKILIAGNVLEPEGMSRAEWSTQQDFNYIREHEYAQGYALQQKLRELAMTGPLDIVADQSVIDAVEKIKNPDPHMRGNALAMTAGVSYNPFNPDPNQLIQDIGHVRVTSVDGQELTIRLNLMQGMKVMEALIELTDTGEWKVPTAAQNLEMQRQADEQIKHLAPYMQNGITP